MGQLMVRFIPAEELKNKYDVFGHFYSVEAAPKKVVECRSVLEIVEQAEIPDETSVLSNRKPDAVFIMINHGSSRPLTDVDNRIHAKSIHELPISLVPTKPDTTQYQIKRVMLYCEWRHVRVLNLSDLRCPKSDEFFKQFKGLEGDFSFDAHSVFSGRRKNELVWILTNDNAIPVVRAWGVSPHLDPMIDRCLSKLGRARAVMGLMKEGTTNKFLHRLPSLRAQQVLWVNRMVEQCQG